MVGDAEMHGLCIVVSMILVDSNSSVEEMIREVGTSSIETQPVVRMSTDGCVANEGIVVVND